MVLICLYVDMFCAIIFAISCNQHKICIIGRKRVSPTNFYRDKGRAMKIIFQLPDDCFVHELILRKHSFIHIYIYIYIYVYVCKLGYI